MPKLDTTIDNLERKSNKVIGTTPSASWDDEQYPSAKTLYSTYETLLNLMHPVNSILITATKDDPSATLGGTWELVDKAFRNNQIRLNQAYWTKENAELGTELVVGQDEDDSESICTWTDHGINLRLKITASVDLTDFTATLGTLDLPALGISELPYSVLFDAACSDGGQCLIDYCFFRDGKLEVYDVINIDDTHTMKSGQFFYVDIQEEIPYNLMDDSFCDKFYWKRTA